MTEQRRLIYQTIEKVLPYLLFLFGIWYFSLRCLGFNLEYVLGDYIDSRFINILLEHGYQWSIGNTGDFWNAPYMYPNENVIALSDSMLGTMPFYGIWRLFGIDHETSYQLWWIVICALNYWVTYYVIKRWYNRRDLAMIFAWIFAFTIFNFGQFSYEQMIIRFPIPVVIYGAVRLIQEGKVKHFALLSFGIVYQFYAVMYTGFYLLYFTLLFMLIYMIVTKNYKFFKPLFKKENLRYTILVAGSALVAMLWLFIPYIEISTKTSFHPYDSIIQFLPTVKSYLFPHPSSYLWGFAHEAMKPDVNAYWLHYTFAGILPLIGIISAPILWIYWKVRSVKPDKLQLAVTITIFVICIFFVRTSDGKSLYFLFYHLPGIGSLRVLNRFMHVGLFFFLLGFILLIKRIPAKWGLLLIIPAILDSAFDQSMVYRVPKSDLVKMRADIDKEVKEKLKPEHIAFAIINDGTDIGETSMSHIDAMNAAIDNHIPTINGYSSSCTGEFWRFMGQNTNENLQFWLSHNGIDSSKVLIIDRSHKK